LAGDVEITAARRRTSRGAEDRQDATLIQGAITADAFGQQPRGGNLPKAVRYVMLRVRFHVFA
jgi:hypothetical protein